MNGPTLDGPLRVGVLGVGHAHGPMWASAFAANPDCELVAIYDQEPGRGGPVAQDNGCRYVPDLLQFLTGYELDAVAITSEHAFHREHIELAAGEGLDILCEKPIATSLKEADAAAEAVATAGVRFMQGFQMRLDPANQEVRGIVARGELGRISSISKRHSHYFGTTGWPDDSGGWFYDPVISGGGAGLDELIHSCDWLRWIFGEPASVTAVMSSHILESPVEDVIAAIFRLQSGAIATLQSSWTDLAGGVTTQIFGDRGTIFEYYTDLASTRCEKLVEASVTVQREPLKRWEHLTTRHSFPAVHEAVANEFIRCLLTKEDFPSVLDDGRSSLAMVLAAYESARTGTSIQFGWDEKGINYEKRP
ncbi:Gfo/Idh/MocA family oxidoreductase [Arthrobacter sp. R1-13]